MSKRKRHFHLNRSNYDIRSPGIVEDSGNRLEAEGKRHFHLNRSDYDIRIPGIVEDSGNRLEAVGMPLNRRHFDELVAGLRNKRLGEYTGFRLLEGSPKNIRIAGTYPGFEVVMDGSPHHVVWNGDRP